MVKRGIIKDFNQTPVSKEERLRPLLGKFWHKIPDSNSLGTRSQDGNGCRKRTFVALYGRISYQMHRARVVRRKTKGVRPSAALSRLSHAEVRSDATRSLEIIPSIGSQTTIVTNFDESNFFDATGKKIYIYYTHF